MATGDVSGSDDGPFEVVGASITMLKGWEIDKEAAAVDMSGLLLPLKWRVGSTYLQVYKPRCLRVKLFLQLLQLSYEESLPCPSGEYPVEYVFSYFLLLPDHPLL